jgi:hypothetical protein
MCLAPHTPFRPILPSAPYSLPPHAPFRPMLPSAPYSLPPQARFRPILPSAPASRPPHTPVRPCLRFRPILPSAPLAGSLRPILPSAKGRPWMFIGRCRVRRRGASELLCIGVLMRCPNVWRLAGSSAAELSARDCAACSARTFAFDGTQRTVSSKNYG